MARPPLLTTRPRGCLTVAEVAAACGYSVRTVTRWISGGATAEENGRRFYLAASLQHNCWWVRRGDWRAFRLQVGV